MDLGADDYCYQVDALGSALARGRHEHSCLRTPYKRCRAIPITYCLETPNVAHVQASFGIETYRRSYRCCAKKKHIDEQALGG